ncbi:3-isopropylmalate dehydratase small subunit [Sporolactobacillus inulinus]|uniref:3-isopropylmalate dehydratase small subunit n=1 Tax=Sporolactobacillus inulinus CASD TaxID=1069536 RepID=A0A0U1QP67_9BACL|nr:3-isopropylmalate dehydratase small subunit [Sporolactobacillus inulinus]KLI02598.1 isopropylmalate isomerase [Sporolactobacillus inulinus CASD]GEB76711.1 3-isopropylmalate dehydratase small subunit [Sporolactobacillus inulinus]
MHPFKTFEGRVCPLDRTNVDTDQIIPKQFLKRVERKGFGSCLFYNWRFDEKGNKKKDFVLNKPEYAQSSILVARDNFGCGSSREHAPWALQDYGFRVIIAPSFADIFYNNCQKNGILAIRLDSPRVDELIRRGATEALALTVDLEQQKLSAPNFAEHFEIDPYQKEVLLKGLDEIAMTLTYEDEIVAYEKQHEAVVH